MQSSAEFHRKTIESLDEKKTTVMELTAASTAAIGNNFYASG